MVSLNIWLRRLLMLLIGVVITEFGSQLLVALRVGADPFMILIQGISRQSGLSYGQTSTALMLLCFAAIFLLERNSIRPGTVFCIFCLGPLVDFYAWLFSLILPHDRSLPITVLLIVLACVIVSLGLSISVTSHAGACSNDLIPVIAHEKLAGMQIRTAQMLWDGVCIIAGYCLGGTLGIGTVIALTLYGPGLQLEIAKPGDTIITLEVPRLARSVKQLCDIIDIIREKHLRLIIQGSITMDCRTDHPDPMTEAFLQIAGVFAQLELAMIRARVKSGMENARAKGKHIGRPETTIETIPDRFLRYYALYKNHDLSISELARLAGVSRPTVYKYIKLIEH